MDYDEEYVIPLTDQKVFGAGVRKSRVQFVPQGSTALETTADIPRGTAIADLYRSIVLEGEPIDSHRKANNQKPSKDISTSATANVELDGVVCEICNLPLKPSNSAVATSSNTHEASLVHQVCLSHSYPPSHIDRARKGLKYLSSYGWDPDSRLGLGVSGDGRLVPIRGKLKNDTLGVGFEEKLRKSNMKIVGVEKRVEKLDAKKVRKLEAEGRKKKARLQEMFYRADDVERYLGLEG